MEGWLAKRMRMKLIVLALASWPANINIKMLPSTSAGDKVGWLFTFRGRLA